MTEPFADFKVETGRLSISMTRTYSSNDWSYAGGPLGVFGRGWHHEWEGALTCTGDVCTVTRGLAPGFQFRRSGTALSLDGVEQWVVYQPWTAPGVNGDHRSLLVRRPSGEWIVFLTDGRELHFAVVCDSCSDAATDPYCLEAASGGKARLVAVVEPNGSAVQLSYQRSAGILLGLHDDLGHALEVRASPGCSAQLATELRYDGATVATYSYDGSDLTAAVDADGNTLRSYAYDQSAGRRLHAVLNEGGDAIAEFRYDSSFQAIGVIDKLSSVSVDYRGDQVLVTESYGDTSSTSIRTLNADGNVASISDNCACGPARTQQWTDRRPTTITDALGRVTSQEFDERGRLTHRSEGGEREEWRGYGVVRAIAQGLGLELEVVTSSSRRSGVNGRQYEAESMSYDPAPLPIDPSGYACQEAPLPAGSVVCRQITGGYAYDASGAVRFERHAVFYSYDAQGRVVRTVGPVNLDNPAAGERVPIEERIYWPSAETLARRGRLRFLKRYADPGVPPLVTSYEYDMFGAYVVKGPDGASTTIIKDGRGRPRFVVAPDGMSSETRYHDGLDPRLHLSPGGATVRSSYDRIGRLESVEHLAGDPEAAGAAPTVAWGEYYRYDAAGNRIHAERRDATGAVTWQQDRAYDVQHRLVSDTNPASAGAARKVAYDPAGFLTGVVDEEGRSTTFTPDALGRVATVTRPGRDAAGAPVSLDVATYAYQRTGDSLAEVSDPVGAGATYQYDDFGRIASVSSRDFAGEVRYEYDARGNVLRRVWNGVTVSYTYDAVDRLLTVSGPDISYAFVYDAAPNQGRLTSIEEPGRTTTFTYDAAGRLHSESIQEAGVAAPLVTSYGYDVDGALRDVSYPTGLRVRYERDPATRAVVRVSNLDTGTRYADQVKHHPGGPLKSTVFGNGQTLTQGVNRRYEPVSIVSGPLTLGYTVGAAGDVTKITDQSLTLSGCARNTWRSFEYDHLDRLTGSPGWLSYASDGAGNRTDETVEDVQASYTYGGAQRDRVLDRVVGGKRTHAFGYDAFGSLSAVGQYDVSGASQTGAVCFRHDALGRMVLYGNRAGAVGPGATACTDDAEVAQPVARFKYDARNRRVARQDVATARWTYVVFDAAGNPLSEIALEEGAWTKVRDYVWMDGRPLAQVEYPGPSGSAEGYAYYFHVDHIGLPRAMTNGAGQIVWNTFPKPYGDNAEKTTTDPLSGRVVVTNLRLPGQYDERLFAAAGIGGLQGPYYNWNRWYLPSVGRYLEFGPAGVGGDVQYSAWGGLVQLREQQSTEVHGFNRPVFRGVLAENADEHSWRPSLLLARGRSAGGQHQLLG